jgi:hypothetical protein
MTLFELHSWKEFLESMLEGELDNRARDLMTQRLNTINELIAEKESQNEHL